jgi:hypothetical protein
MPQATDSHRIKRGISGRRRRRGVAAVCGLMCAGASALLTPTLFQPAAAAEIRQFTAEVRTGVQIYDCTADAQGATSFVFRAPRAELQRAIHHDAGPIWQHPDGSAVKGTVRQQIKRPGTIPELTLSAEQIGADHGLLACVDTIRRINTTGRLAPARPCTVGAVAEVPYTATYVFSGRSPAAPHVNSAPGK